MGAGTTVSKNSLQSLTVLVDVHTFSNGLKTADELQLEKKRIDLSFRMFYSHHRNHELLALAETIELLRSVLTTFEHVFLKLNALFFRRKVLDNIFNLLGGESITVAVNDRAKLVKNMTRTMQATPSSILCTHILSTTSAISS